MATNTVQYPDGRQEIINVPKAFSVGDVVAVTHRRDGGVVVQKCGEIAPFRKGQICIYLGDVTSGKTIKYTTYVKQYIPNEQSVLLNFYTHVINSEGMVTSGSAKLFSSTADWGAQSIGNMSVSITGEAYLMIDTLFMVAGDYIRLDLIKHNGSFKNGETITDGSFESGVLNMKMSDTVIPEYGDKNLNWIRNYGGMVRIINTDAYSGSYCCEFYG